MLANHFAGTRKIYHENGKCKNHKVYFENKKSPLGCPYIIDEKQKKYVTKHNGLWIIKERRTYE